ncbi:alpha/beta hydrolase [Archangium violaceum]|uniref:alpha/beta fold hydrolase n=1 Tax=Archangium violaceum TaxID=83451 RepID=UPI00193C55F2|nr:alpha/beta hydrolase [Archangium violaceum]QRK05938.1 alpha/beta hydrolase [Archangium violaceum]
MDHVAFRARQQVLELEGIVPLPVRVAYTDVGQGPPLVLLHGIPTWSYLYSEVIPLLAPRYRVIAPDFLGHGWSDRRDCFDRSLRVHARLVLRLLDALGLARATLVGHDTGGGAALILAIEHPARVERLVLTNTVAYDSWPIDDMLALANPRWRQKPPEEVVRFLQEGLPEGLSRPERLTAEFREGIVAPYADEEGKLSLIRDASALNTNHTTALVHRHGDITAPTLLLWGEDDPQQPVSDGERLAREIPGATLVRVSRASHWVQQDAPAEFAETVAAFLEGSSR